MYYAVCISTDGLTYDIRFKQPTLIGVEHQLSIWEDCYDDTINLIVKEKVDGIYSDSDRVVFVRKERCYFRGLSVKACMDVLKGTRVLTKAGLNEWFERSSEDTIRVSLQLSKEFVLKDEWFDKTEELWNSMTDKEKTKAVLSYFSHFNK